MLSQNRQKFRKISENIGSFFARSGISPNAFTIFSVFLGALCFWFLFKNNLIWAIIFFVLASISDLIDGAVARARQKVTKEGAYLDTICDRYVEAMALLGFLFLPLPEFIVEAKFWILLSLFGSLMTTYAKAAAKEKEVVLTEFKKGLLERPERIILILLAMLLGGFSCFSGMIYLIVFLAVFSNLTAMQRIFLVFKKKTIPEKTKE